MVNDLQISELTYCCIPTNESITPTEDIDAPMVKSDRNQSHENVDQSTDPIIPQLSGIVADLDNEFTDILDRPDRNEIIRGLTTAVLVQEMTRMTVTKIRMAVGSRRSINKAQLHSDWLTLCRHYAGGKHETFLDNGVTQLEKLTPEEAQETIHSIRQVIEPDLNWAMERKVVKIGFDVPLVGKIGIGKFSLNLSGTRAAMLTLRGRLIRLLVQSVLWISVVLGTLHWLVWILFNELFFTTNFESLAKFTYFTLLLSTTFMVWILTRNPSEVPGAKHSRILRSVWRISAWCVVVAGWCYLLTWFLFGLPIEAAGLEVATKLLLPFFLAVGCIAAWISGEIFRGNGKDGL